MIAIQNAAFGYGAAPVLSNVDLTIDEGDFIGVVGVNGSGKTTLLRGALGLIEPLSGCVVRDPRALRRVGYVPQRGQLDPVYPLTVFDVARMGFHGKGAARPAVLACLEKVRMAPHADASYAALSGGQQQRVLIARALAVAPRALMLDEPTSGVDAATEKDVMDVLLELNASEKIAVLLVSHKIPLLSRCTKTTVFLRKEGILQGPSREILAHEKWEKILEDVL